MNERETAGTDVVMRLAAALALGVIGCSQPVIAGQPFPPEVAIRTGEHPGFGRMVLDVPAGRGVRVSALGGDVVLRFTGPVRIDEPAGLPRNVRALVADGAQAATVELAAGATARFMRLGGRLVIDAHDPVSARARIAQPAEVEAVLPTLARMPSRSQKPGQDGEVGAAAVETILPTLARIAPAPAPAPARPPPASAFLPFPAGVGAAALVRAGRLLVVFDHPQPMSLPPGPLLRNASISLLPDGMVITLPPTAGLALSREADGWLVRTGAGPALPAIAVERPAGAVLLRTPHPGRIVAIPDPASGAVLLVGTETAAADRAETGWQTPDFAVLPTILGVAAEPFSDRVQLAAEPAGFRIGADVGTLPLAAGPLSGSLAQQVAALTRSLQLPDLPLDVLRGRMLREQTAAAEAAPLARSEPRLDLARTLLAMGMEDDALGVLGLAATTDPNLPHDPRFAFLSGAAEVLAGRPDQAAWLSDPHLPKDDDVALWRALRAAEADTVAAGTAAVLARTAPILLLYPDPVRRVLLPLGTETMIEGGQTAAAAALLKARPADPTLAMARAMEQEATGDTTGALAGYDALADGPDRLTRIRAAMRAIDLRVAKAMLTPGAAADALDRLDPAWRGDRIELARREREAELRAEAGDVAAALSGLRDTAALFPAASAELRQRSRAIMTQALTGITARTMKPAALAAMLDANLDALADAVARSVPDLRQRIEAQLLSRDLPVEAAPAFARLIEGAPPDATRAALGARLAELRMAGGEDREAQEALAETATDTLPPGLAAHRAVLAAQLRARGGDVPGAVAALAGIGGAEAERVQADLAERAGDYAAAAAALLAEAEQELPAAGPLDTDAQALGLRLASDAARGNDAAALAEIRARWLDRMPRNEAGDTVRLLLAPPVRRIADLARAAQETNLAAAVADGLRAPAAAAPRP